jgi:diaminohydroxyphosphoribosylaminopyrimidine deaminase / 5-amino-6-(5-phosphoribosylamino)uracil reductase
VNDGDSAYLRRALRLAARGAGRTSPEPLVGAVIVSDAEVVGAAYRRVPGVHGEIDAIAKAGERARGATLYTNVEPCGECVQAIVDARIGRVVVGMRDPDARLAGKGIRALRTAGIAIEEGLLREEAETLNAGVVTRLSRGRPLVTLVLETTVDGRVLDQDGRRAKEVARGIDRLRDRADAVMVGSAIVARDDPALTVRAATGHDPLRVVIDADARTPIGSKLMRNADPQRTVIFVARDADARRRNRLSAAGVLLVSAARGENGVDPAAVLRWLGEHGVNTVSVEDPALAAPLVRARLADRLVLFVAPIAGGGGMRILDGVPDPAKLRGMRVRRVGAQIAIEGSFD